MSVITVVFNGVASLEATIQSVLSQRNQNFEYIILDGGSTDGTLEIIKKYELKITYWKSEPDRGIYDAMNKAIDLAEGEWINFMNSGDVFENPDALAFFGPEAMVPEADIIYGNAIIKYPAFTTVWKRTDLDEMWKRSPFCHQAAFVKCSTMKKYGFDLSFKISSDFDFFYRAFLDGIVFLYIPQTICVYDLIDGISEKNRLASLLEQRRSVLKHNFSAGKWLYFASKIVKQEIVVMTKRLLGRKATQWITRYLKA